MQKGGEIKDRVKFRVKDRPYVLPLLLLVFILTFFISFALGRYPVDPITLVKILLSRILPLEETWSSQAETVVFNIRLPRVLIGAFIGAGLSLSGLVYQGIFQNPMVSPDVLGSTSGAAAGSALGIMAGMGYFSISAMSFLGGITAVLIVLMIARRVPGQPVLGLVLSGIMISSLFNSLLSFIKLVADTDDVLPQITYYLIGSLSSTRNSDLAACALLITVPAIVLYLIRWNLIGCDYRKTIPATILMGSSFLMLVDTVSRNLTTSEIPIGILTSFIGAPFFLYLIIREGKKT